MNDVDLAFKTRPLAIVGRSVHAAQLALRRVLRAKERDQPLIVIDYQGAAAALLDETNRGNLHKTPLLWCDLANRRKPAAIFRMRRSDGLMPSLKAFLAQSAGLVTNPLSEATIEWAAKLVWELADQGTVGLAALHRGLHRPEILQWFRREHTGTDQINRLTNLLGWLLRFPAVWAAAEGNNPLDLQGTLKKNGTVWFEMPSQHFEKIEHQVVSHMAEAAVLDLLLSQKPDGSVTGAGPKPPVILYAFAPAVPLSFRAETAMAKHVGVFGLSAEHALPKSAQTWLDAKADCWVVGDTGPVAAGTGWLTEDELSRVRTLQPGELWARSGVNGKAITMRVRVSDHQLVLAHFHRRHSLKGRRATPVKQFSSAIAAIDRDTEDGIDLYGPLCRKENLLGGWLRVKNHDRESHGCDHVTIAQFGAHVERELDRLADDLESGRYRCRPLRTVRIRKADGGERVLKIACIRDQVAQATCLGLLEPIFEPRFSHFSFAYRPNRSAHHALAWARSLIRTGKAWAVTADIQSCFDTVDHDILLRLLGDVMGDRNLLRLIRHWLSVDAFDFDGLVPSELGVPQGEALSPLLANVYLDPLDKEFERTGIAFARYADDYVILCETKAEAEVALRLMTDFLHSVLRLSLKPAKTQYCPIAQGAGFLGFMLDDRQVRIQQEKLDRATNAIRRRLEILASPSSTFSAKSAALQHMNALIRGFRNYFLVDDAPQIVSQLRALDAEIEKVARALLPISLRHEIAWLARERLVPAESTEHPDGAAATDPTNIIGTYPNYRGAAPSSDWAQAADARDTTQVATVESDTVKPGRQPEDSQTDDTAEDKDGVLIDGRLYVMTAGSYVTVQRDDLVVRRRQEELRRIPLDTLTMLVLQGPGVGISVDLTIKLSERDVPVVFAPPYGRPAAIAASLQGGHSRLRQQQILRKNDPAMLNVGVAMLAAKTGNQASVLKYFARYRKKQTQRTVHDELAKAAADIRSLADTMKELDASSSGLRSTAMGYEGRAAALYWSSLAQLIPEELSFPGRRTRQATDPFNQAVNYVYGVLYGEVWKAIVHAGLDPYTGIMHGTERDQGSLIFDLIEEFRAPFGDRLVLGMLGRRFQPQLGKHGNLRTSVRRLLVRAFHRMWNRPIRWRGKMVPPSRILEQQAKGLAGAFLAEETYRPFQFRW